MPSLQEILAGYERVNAWEHEEERQRLPELTVVEAIRRYVEMWDLARRLAPEAESVFRQERMSHYEYLHTQMERAAEDMGRVQQD
jgi:hypothetical protein